MVTIFVLNKLSLLMKATVSYQAITCTSDNTRICYGKNNGFTTNDWREKHIIVYSIDFALFLPEANFVRGTFEDFLVSDKI